MRRGINSEVENVEWNLSEWRERHNPSALLRARAALMDACEEIMTRADKESRAMNADERRAFDHHAEIIRDINTDLAEYKRQRVADVVAAGFPAEYCRLPF
jgi:hypothetical protein